MSTVGKDAVEHVGKAAFELARIFFPRRRLFSLNRLASCVGNRATRTVYLSALTRRGSMRSQLEGKERLVAHSSRDPRRRSTFTSIHLQSLNPLTTDRQGRERSWRNLREREAEAWEVRKSWSDERSCARVVVKRRLDR